MTTLPGAKTGRGRPALALAELRAWTIRNRLRQGRQRRRSRRLVRGAMAAIVVFVLGLSIFVATFTATRSASSAEEATHVLATLFALVVIAGFIGAMGSALQSFYLASDLPFLLSLPVPLRVTFAAKLVDSMTGVLPVAVVLVAALAGYGGARSDRWWFVVPAAVVGLLLLVSTAALGVLVVAAIGRLLPPRRTGHVLGALSLLLIVLLWAAYAAVAPDVSARERVGGGSASPLALTLATAGERVAWTPVGWAASATVAAAEGTAASVVAPGALVLVATIGLVATAFSVFAATFARAYAGFRVTAISLRRPDRPLTRWVAAALSPLPSPLAALILKEWLTMFRDLRRLSGAVWPLGMVAVYTVLLSREQSEVPVGAPGLAFWMSCGTLALVPWGASLGISIYAFGTERRQIHLLRVLPVRPRTLLMAKVLASLVPVMVLSGTAAIVVGSIQGATIGQLLGLLGLVAWATVGYVAIDTATSAIAPNFEAEQVQRTTALAGRIVGFAAGAVFTLASGAAAARLVLFATGVPDDLQVLLGSNADGLQPFGWPLVIAGAAIAALVVAFMLAIAHERVAAVVREA